MRFSLKKCVFSSKSIDFLWKYGVFPMFFRITKQHEMRPVPELFRFFFANAARKDEIELNDLCFCTLVLSSDLSRLSSLLQPSVHAAGFRPANEPDLNRNKLSFE